MYYLRLTKEQIEYLLNYINDIHGSDKLLELYQLVDRQKREQDKIIVTRVDEDPLIYKHDGPAPLVRFDVDTGC